MPEKEPKILITGGMGFIFSHVTEYFLKKGWKVFVIDNFTKGSHPELLEPFRKYDNFCCFNKDVSFTPVIETIKSVNPDYIVHAAAISDVDESIRNPLKVIQANNNGTINVFEAARLCKGLKKLLYVSTDEVYGECDHPKTETEILFPKNPYALSKSFGSQLRLAYDNTYPSLKNKTVETRFCNVFGPRQDDRKIIPAIIRAQNGGPALTLHNGGEGYRQFIYVKDIPPVIDLLLERGDRTYNICAEIGWTVKELIASAKSSTGKDVPFVQGRRSGMDIKYQMSAERIRTELGWRHKYPVVDALHYLFSGKEL